MNKTFHFGYPAPSLSTWLRQVEQNNVPHFMRGFWIGTFSWLFGIVVWPGDTFAWLFSFCIVLGMTLVWEWRDYYVADGWDFLDNFSDLLGWFGVYFVVKWLGK